MKEICLDGRNLQYKAIHEYSPGEHGYSFDYTEFFEGYDVRTRRTGFLGLFGKKESYKVPKKVFVIYKNADDPNLPKEFWKKEIRKQLKKLDRKKQLEKGELI